MKKISTFALRASCLALMAVAAAWGKSPTSDYVEAYRGRTDMPVPVVVVVPSISTELAPETAEVAFTVDEAGIPRRVRVITPLNEHAEVIITEAVKRWKFAPLLRDGQAVKSKVILPLRFVSSDSASRLVSL